MENVGTQERPLTGVQVGSHEGLNHRSSSGGGKGQKQRHLVAESAWLTG